MTTELTTAQLSVPLNDKLHNKKRALKFRNIGDVLQAMYKTITVHKMWDEVKEVKGK